MKFWFRLFFLLLFVSLLFESCTTETDIEVPQLDFKNLDIEIGKMTVCGEEVSNGLTLIGGKKFRFQVTCRDNDALSQFKLDIHNNFDCHGHGSVLVPAFPSPSVENLTEDMNKQTIFPLSGKDTTFVISVDIPENVTSGNYHVGFQLIDISGNAAESIFLDARILNPLDTVPPVIHIYNSANIPRNMLRGDTLTISGYVTDNKPLGSGGNGVVFMNYTNLSSGNSFSTDSYMTMGHTEQTDTTFNLKFRIPLFLVKGEYRFSVLGSDGVRNISSPFEFIVNVQ